MLVLTRQPGQTIMIGDAVVTIISVVGENVRVGIDAPQDVDIVRGELADGWVPRSEGFRPRR